MREAKPVTCRWGIYKATLTPLADGRWSWSIGSARSAVSSTANSKRAAKRAAKRAWKATRG